MKGQFICDVRRNEKSYCVKELAIELVPLLRASPTSTVGGAKLNIYNKSLPPLSLQIGIESYSRWWVELEFLQQERKITLRLGYAAQTNLDAVSRRENHIG